MSGNKPCPAGDLNPQCKC